MKELANFCASLKHKHTKRILNPNEPVGWWKEKENFQGSPIDAFVIILRTKGCHWAYSSGCTMCGYYTDSDNTVTANDILQQFEKAMYHYDQEKHVKIFTSGSFLDDNELPPRVREYIINRLVPTVKKLSIESRPEFIKKETLTVIKHQLSDCLLEIGIGLETANDMIQEDAINKGFTYRHYQKAAKIVNDYDFLLKTYLLLKPPFLTEKQSIRDCLTSINMIKSSTHTISLNPTNIQRGTVVEYLWQRKLYRPPWLWSVVEVLQKSKPILRKVRIQCDISGGGTRRGAHNCGSCDKDFLYAISSFSLDQNPSILQGLNCHCYNAWRDQLRLEPLSFGSLIDINGKKYYE